METDLLFAHGAALGFCANLFHPEFNRTLLHRCAEEGLSGSWPLPLTDETTRENQAAVLDALDTPTEEYLSAIEADNTALFIGPVEPVPMWESVWRTRERLLYGDCTEEVRLAYAQAGFTTPDDIHEPEDHLSLELTFLAALLIRSGQILEDGRPDAAAGELETARAFHHLHTSLWAFDCLREIGRLAATPFYRGAADLCARTLFSLEALFGR
ncbi:TorD/DmsD family molecular chaperone [Telmatospirillum siberiense]|nr:molecular chaperone TorD family protein [Telmatospirillum siberiense]